MRQSQSMGTSTNLHNTCYKEQERHEREPCPLFLVYADILLTLPCGPVELFCLFFCWWCCQLFKTAGAGDTSSSKHLAVRGFSKTTLLLFLCSQLYLWGSPYFVRFFAYVIVSNPTTEVVIFHLRGWCMLGAFLLPIFACLGHECQDLLSLCNGMHVCTDWTSIYTLKQKNFRDWSQNPC